MKPQHARMAMAAAMLVGLFASLYLFYTYVTGAPISCVVIDGCDAVRASRWANVYGIPTPFFGIVFYSVMFALLVIRSASNWRPHRLRQLTLLGATIGFLESAYLFYIQVAKINSFCSWCLASAVAATAIFLFALFDRPHEGDALAKQKELRTYFEALLAFLPAASLAFLYLVRT